MDKFNVFNTAIISAAVLLVITVISWAIVHTSASTNEKRAKIQIACINQGGSFANDTCIFGSK